MNGNGGLADSEFSEKSVSGTTVSDRAVSPNPERQTGCTKEEELRIHQYLVILDARRAANQHLRSQHERIQVEQTRSFSRLADLADSTVCHVRN